MTECNRKCWDCGNVAMHEDNIVPHVLCKKCGSQDTRLVNKMACPICKSRDYEGELIQTHPIHDDYCCYDCMSPDQQKAYDLFEQALTKEPKQ